ncbi:MAG: hypothetical protein ISS48_01860 [Candidatus Aenigmarchaeota archaeon]|nr:hypothetical protein [Candidatus Aenigmarchaeota archaeon]
MGDIHKSMLAYGEMTLAGTIEKLNQYLGCSTCPPKYHCCESPNWVRHFPVNSARLLFGDELFEDLVNREKLIVSGQTAILIDTSCPLYKNSACSIYHERERHGIVKCIRFPIYSGMGPHRPWLHLNWADCYGLQISWDNIERELELISHSAHVSVDARIKGGDFDLVRSLSLGEFNSMLAMGRLRKMEDRI